MLNMDQTNDIPIYDMERGPEYTDLDKQNILASILKEPLDDNLDIGDSERNVLEDEQVLPSDGEISELDEIEPKKMKGSKPRIRCHECQRFTTDNEEKMVRHIRKNHQGQNPFQCTMCDYTTYNKSVFEEHIRVHKGIKPFKCSFCPYRSASKKNKNKHELIHRQNNPLKCDLCPFIAHHYSSLQCHKEKHEKGQLDGKTELTDLKCDVCCFEFPTEMALQRHKNSKSRVCDVCSATFCSSYYLKKHKSICHDVRNEMFQCAVCGWTGSMKVKVLLHLVHHPRQEVDESLYDVSVLRRHGIMK
ncbi:zinc finger protein 64-like [Plodia interpunctella]|uniref:zinc finger protein 64-like n=1 Tax=Plodia interpunctella TaxID=58824 RepID=UPI002368A2D5|nr:zinc finger protein 64-like [Plodia interpunctella]XP_053622913.1 zinc finger protein 64-like [Plodia interpunctella]XP_053622914.1 zinc finger protein 64-like [Plodia interpunctella]